MPDVSRPNLLIFPFENILICESFDYWYVNDQKAVVASLTHATPQSQLLRRGNGSECLKKTAFNDAVTSSLEQECECENDYEPGQSTA